MTDEKDRLEGLSGNKESLVIKPAIAAGLVTVIVILLALLAQEYLWRYALEQEVDDRFAEMDRNAFLLGARVRGRANDMFFLKRVAEAALVRDPHSPVASDNFRTAVTTMLLARSQYDRIRLLDLSGHEMFRYNWKEADQPLEEVSADKLQDKSTRPFYRETLNSTPDTVIFSPLDLDIDYNQIVTPIKPTLRVSGQIVGPDGKVKALLVLNYMGDQLLREIQMSKGQSRQMMLLNEDGYWLAGPDERSEWAFMYPERANESLRVQDPGMWSKITAGKVGWFDQNGNLICFQAIDPVGTPTDYPPLRMPIKGANGLRWILLTRVPNAVVWDNVREIDLGIWLTCIAGVLTLAPLTWFGLSSILRRRQAMAELRRLTYEAQAANRAKSEFLAVMSHEIRTPMNGVVGMTSILSDTKLDELQHDCVNTINTSGESLLAVINDILDFSKIESGRMQMENRAFDLRQVVEEALDLFAAQIRVRRLEAVYLIDQEIPGHLIGDSTRLRQVLVNLIGNAIKFTARGEIAINVKCLGKDENGYRLQFSVRDTGIGIPKESLQKLFQAFQQVDASTTRRYGGTGLGLVISKRLAEFMGGTMWVESRPGAGSTFFFTVVLKASPEPVAKDTTLEPGLLNGHTALIVDDNETNLNILDIQLKIWGMQPTAVSSGREALEKLNGQSFDVGLIDLQMPEMDGIMLAREIHVRKAVPLVLLSSSGEALTGGDAMQFQFQIPKPIKHSHLLNALLKITGTERRLPPVVIEKKFDDTLGRRNPLRILLAEDNGVNQKVGLLMLSRFGYSASLAANGQLVLDAIEKATFDLVLMDIQMPDLNGIEAARILRERLGSRCPTIIALTAEALEGDRERFLGLGFDGYLSKPLQAKALQEVLEAVKPLEEESELAP
ncbi:MAG: response regulator [Methylacidiphilales bacterium]|nr:response regulator [Candidatus Methylacidiphilales bacterium]